MGIKLIHIIEIETCAALMPGRIAAEMQDPAEVDGSTSNT